MEHNTFLEDLKTLVQNEDVLAVSREVSELKNRFEDFMLEEERKDQIAALDAQDKAHRLVPCHPTARKGGANKTA